MATSLRIVLLDPLGDEIFSGSSVLSSAPPPPPAEEPAPLTRRLSEDDEEEAVPPTLRSSVFVRVYESGEYRASRPIEVVDAAEQEVAAAFEALGQRTDDSGAAAQRKEEDNRAA